ncbi:MAG TPA: DinB family protein [Bacteroidia bacterium]|nr:DinB family protein [Bacteroidia bacterium]
MSGNLLLRYANYNKWANQRITNAIVSAGETVADTEMKSSFNTVRKTIYHIYDSQHTWIMRIQNKPYSWPPSKDFKGDLNEFSKLLIESSQEWINYISNLNDVDFKKIISYKNTKGIDHQTPLEEIIMHCFNHSTYHRGQLVTMLRQAGVNSFEPMDFIAFVR